MTATVQPPPSPDLSQRDPEGYYSIQRMPDTPGTVYSFQVLGLDFDSPCNSSGQQSYFQPSTPVSQDHHLGHSSYFVSAQSPYSPQGYRSLSRCGGKDQSNENTVPMVADTAVRPDMGLMPTPEYSMADTNYSDLAPNGYFDADQRISRLDESVNISLSPGYGSGLTNWTQYANEGNFGSAALPPAPPRRSTRSTSNVSKVINHKPAITSKIGANGETVKVARVLRPARKRKSGVEKSERPKLPKLTKPLSELTRDYDELPIKNMDSWVHRSAEVRKQEVEKRNGYIPRPMNSFMLYRSAFAERTKMWCLQNNHQVVSSVSGESWPLEPLAIREKYNELAKIERTNHQSAHPGYKFSPSKAQGKKKKDAKGPEESEASELEGLLDDDDEYVGAPGSAQARKSTRNAKKSVKGSNQNTVNPLGGYMGLCYDHTEGGAQRSSFTHNNPGKTPPLCMGSTDMHLSGQYYQTTVRASPTTTIPSSLHPSVIEDVTIRKTQAPMATMNMPHSPPGAYRVDSVDPMEGFGLSSAFDVSRDNSKVDPALLSSEPDGNTYMGGGRDRAADSEQRVQFIDEGIFDGQFDIDRLFAASADIQISDLPFPDGGTPQDGIDQAGRNGSGSAFDVHKLSNFEQSMQGFLDSQEHWSGNGEAATHEEGDQLRYDEWLQ